MTNLEHLERLLADTDIFKLEPLPYEDSRGNTVGVELIDPNLVDIDDRAIGEIFGRGKAQGRAALICAAVNALPALIELARISRATLDAGARCTCQRKSITISAEDWDAMDDALATIEALNLGAEK